MGNGGNFLWVIMCVVVANLRVFVWEGVVLFMDYCVSRDCNVLWVTVWRVVVICYRLLCGEWW